MDAAATTIRDDTTERHLRKYANRNPLQRLALGRFYDAVAEEIRAQTPRTMLDFGCGEGFLLDKMAARDVAMHGYTGLDLRADAIDAARDRWPRADFRVADLFEWPEAGRTFDMVLALEVLEHLPSPERFMARLAELSGSTLLLTVPHEPWFQLANLARGRDLIRLGNHPEHINHWNPKTFADFVADYADVVSVRSVFPFVVLTARPR